MEINLQEDWVEWLALVFLLLGFLISLMTSSFLLNIIVIILSGLIVGRSFYIIKHSSGVFPFIVVTLGFLLGYLVGGFVHGYSKLAIIILFLISAIVSYQLHRRKILVIFKSENFLK
jgi:4-hydroxybenzoate polyprenyltransferase